MAAAGRSDPSHLQGMPMTDPTTPPDDDPTRRLHALFVEAIKSGPKIGRYYMGQYSAIMRKNLKEYERIL